MFYLHKFYRILRLFMILPKLTWGKNLLSRIYYFTKKVKGGRRESAKSTKKPLALRKIDNRLRTFHKTAPFW